MRMSERMMIIYRDPCWSIYGRNKMILLSACSCSLISILVAYNTCTKTRRHEALSELSALFLITGLTFTLVVNLFLAIVHVGQALSPQRFRSRAKRILTTDTQKFRFSVSLTCPGIRKKDIVDDSEVTANNMTKYLCSILLLNVLKYSTKDPDILSGTYSRNYLLPVDPNRHLSSDVYGSHFCLPLQKSNLLHVPDNIRGIAIQLVLAPSSFFLVFLECSLQMSSFATVVTTMGSVTIALCESLTEVELERLPVPRRPSSAFDSNENLLQII